MHHNIIRYTIFKVCWKYVGIIYCLLFFWANRPMHIRLVLGERGDTLKFRPGCQLSLVRHCMHWMSSFSYLLNLRGHCRACWYNPHFLFFTRDNLYGMWDNAHQPEHLSNTFLPRMGIWILLSFGKQGIPYLLSHNVDTIVSPERTVYE